MTRASVNIDYYQNSRGMLMGVVDKLILKLKNNVNLEIILNKYNLKLEKILSKNLYLLKTTDKNLTIDISNKLSEKDFVEYCHPDFIKKRVNR